MKDNIYLVEHADHQRSVAVTARCMRLAMVLEVDSVLVARTPLLVLHFWNLSNTSSSGKWPSTLEASTASVCRPRAKSFHGVKEKTENLDTAIASLCFLTCNMTLQLQYTMAYLPLDTVGSRTFV